jgi:hypothetical protein
MGSTKSSRASGFSGRINGTDAKRTAVADLERYLTTNRARMRYQTFGAAAYAIGSGAVESAVSYVVQQPMKRVGMRLGRAARLPCWRSVDLSNHGCVGPFLGYRLVA